MSTIVRRLLLFFSSSALPALFARSFLFLLFFWPWILSLLGKMTLQPVSFYVPFPLVIFVFAFPFILFTIFRGGGRGRTMWESSIREFCSGDFPVLMVSPNCKYTVMTMEEVCDTHTLLLLFLFCLSLFFCLVLLKTLPLFCIFRPKTPVPEKGEERKEGQGMREDKVCMEAWVGEWVCVLPLWWMFSQEFYAPKKKRRFGKI